MKIGGDWISQPGTQALCAALSTAGHKALFVGGCVRNALMGLPVGDIDIATDATPQIVTNTAESAGFKVVPTGLDHGTVTVIAGAIPHEVTSFRRDVKTDGRRAVVAFTSEIREDAARRDFTMNALYADADGTVIDPLGGLADVQNRRVRFVGDAQQRIREDYLRILRFFRFQAHYGDPSLGLDAEGLAACAALSDGLASLSHERVGHEMRKLLAAPDPAPSVCAMMQAGILGQVLPGADPQALAPLVHLEAGALPNWRVRLAVIGGVEVSQRLWLSKAESANLGHIRDHIGSALTPAALGWTLGAALATDAVLARAAVLAQALPDHWQAEIARGATADFPVRAADLMPDLQGPALGERLKQLQTRWLQSNLTVSRGDLLG